MILLSYLETTDIFLTCGLVFFTKQQFTGIGTQTTLGGDLEKELFKICPITVLPMV